MVLNKYRYLLPRFINGPMEYCIKHKISPNQITFMGFIFSVIAGITYAFPSIFIYNLWLSWVPPVIFLFSAYLDVLDGAVARKTGQTSKFGAFLDSTLDRVSDAVIVLGLMYASMIWPWDLRINNLIGFVALGSMLLISYTRSRAELEGVVMKGIGFMERAERVFILLGGYIIETNIYTVEQAFLGAPPHFPYFYPIFFLVFTLLCIQTLVARILWAYRWLSGKMPDQVAAIIKEEKEAKEKSTRSSKDTADREKATKDTAEDIKSNTITH